MHILQALGRGRRPDKTEMAPEINMRVHPDHQKAERCQAGALRALERLRGTP